MILQSMPSGVSGTTEPCCHASQLSQLSLWLCQSRAKAVPGCPTLQWARTGTTRAPRPGTRESSALGIIGGKEVNNSGEDLSLSIVGFWSAKSDLESLAWV